ncbi:MAG: transposase [Methanotrichaceae archaeon]|nr:transposase [Methanotrichaceae archaeon]
MDGTKTRAEFGTILLELMRFKAWLIGNDCNVVAMESTGTYWIPVYSVLEGNIEVIVANPYMTKHIPGKKTDITDSEWLAELCFKDLIVPSRIFSKEDRMLRSLTRSRETLVTFTIIPENCNIETSPALFLENTPEPAEIANALFRILM